MKKAKKYQVLSPDGFSIEFNKVYSSIPKAKKAFENWAARFKTQGYYSSNNGRILLQDLEYYCQLIEL